MTKPKNQNKNNNNMSEEFKKRIEELESKNKALEERFAKLEETQAILTHVNSMLSKEVDRLNQYTRRSTIVIRNVFLPEKETVEQVENGVKDIIMKMDLPEVLPDFDKAHRLGKVKTVDGKKMQDVIARFKSHSSRYKVFNRRKSVENVRISPHLTKTRSQLLADAVNLTNAIEKVKWGFVFANSHGDLLLRTNEKHKGKHYFSFDSVDSLNKQLVEIGLLPQ